MNKIQIIKQDNRFHVFEGTTCSGIECAEMGCSFPYCADFKETDLETLEKAKEKYPDAEFIGEH